MEIDDKSWVERCRFVGVKDAEAGWRVCGELLQVIWYINRYMYLSNRLRAGGIHGIPIARYRFTITMTARPENIVSLLRYFGWWPYLF